MSTETRCIFSLQVNLKRPCPFWPNDDQCSIKDCHVEPCPEVRVQHIWLICFNLTIQKRDVCEVESSFETFCFMQFFFMHTAWLFTPTTISIYSIYFLFQSQVPVGIKSGNYNKVRDWYVFAFRNILCLVWSVELSFFVCYVTSKVLLCLFSCVKRERSVFVCLMFV